MVHRDFGNAVVPLVDAINYKLRYLMALNGLVLINTVRFVPWTAAAPSLPIPRKSLLRRTSGSAVVLVKLYHVNVSPTFNSPSKADAGIFTPRYNVTGSPSGAASGLNSFSASSKSLITSK